MVCPNFSVVLLVQMVVWRGFSGTQFLLPRPNVAAKRQQRIEGKPAFLRFVVAASRLHFVRADHGNQEKPLGSGLNMEKAQET